MKKLVLVLLVLMATTVFSQSVEELKKKRKAEISEGWGTMGLSVFAYGLSASTAINPPERTVNVATYVGAFCGVSLNLLAIRHFVKARKIKKKIKTFEL